MLLSATYTAASALPPVAQTSLGPVVGLRTGATNSFLGIPYAEPPVGELRWKDPIDYSTPYALPGWDATAYGAVCPQQSGGSSSAVTGEEDCLFLNIFTPASAAPDGEPRAVMFWVHGGAYMAGSGRLDDAQYGSGELEMAAEGVVHVSINYRLGTFGFLSLDDGHAESNNAGLLDQLSALRWVQRHIRSFGGDPSRVFLYGHSAGGESVMALQRMPQAKGLFHAAAALSPLAKIGATPADAAAAWRRLAAVPPHR